MACKYQGINDAILRRQGCLRAGCSIFFWPCASTLHDLPTILVYMSSSLAAIWTYEPSLLPHVHVLWDCGAVELVGQLLLIRSIHLRDFFNIALHTPRAPFCRLMTLATGRLEPERADFWVVLSSAVCGEREREIV